jgi:hypothetical protein
MVSAWPGPGFNIEHSGKGTFELSPKKNIKYGMRAIRPSHQDVVLGHSLSNLRFKRSQRDQEVG